MWRRGRPLNGVRELSSSASGKLSKIEGQLSDGSEPSRARPRERHARGTPFEFCQQSKVTVVNISTANYTRLMCVV